jgi:hypothetical protein
MASYQKPKAMQWISPVMKGYKLACCDCGLVHRIDFKVIRWGRGHKVLFRADRLPRSTAMVRRHKKAAARKKQA